MSAPQQKEKEKAPAQEVSTALEQKLPQKPANNWWCVSGGKDAIAGGFLSVAVGDGTSATGDTALAISDELTLGHLGADQLTWALDKLFFIRGIHQLLEHRQHVEQIERLIVALIENARESYKTADKEEKKEKEK